MLKSAPHLDLNGPHAHAVLRCKLGRRGSIDEHSKYNLLAAIGELGHRLLECLDLRPGLGDLRRIRRFVSNVKEYIDLA